MNRELYPYELDIINAMGFEKQVLGSMHEDAYKVFPEEADEILNAYNSHQINKQTAYVQMKDLLSKIKFQ